MRAAGPESVRPPFASPAKICYTRKQRPEVSAVFQRDYILRMIEMMGDLMRRVKELMDELAQMRLLEEVCRRQCGLPLSALETLSTESLTELLSPTPRLFASELIYLRATASPSLWEEGRMLRLKSLRLLLTLAQEGPLCELRAARVQALKLELMDLRCRRI